MGTTKDSNQNHSNIKAEGLFEVGKLYCDRGDFFLAITKLSEAAEEYLQAKDFAAYLKTQNLLLRLFAETDQSERINEVKERLQDLVIKEGFELNSKTYYTLALCASYKAQNEMASEYLNKAMELGLASDNKADICYALNGQAMVLCSLGRVDEALKEINKLYVFLEVLDLPEVKVSTLLVHAKIFRSRREFENALQHAWRAYELIRHSKTMQMHINILYILGRTYVESGDIELARLYLNLAAKAVDPTNMIRLNREIQKDLAEVGLGQKSAYDLVFDFENHAVTERKLGRVDFKNQFILLDLLRLFVQNQGEVYSKEFLVETVWRQSYDPSVHDNKVYVTIKRLRKLIEPDFDRPKYIFRAKNGYFMNRTARIMINEKEGEQAL